MGLYRERVGRLISKSAFVSKITSYRNIILNLYVPFADRERFRMQKEEEKEKEKEKGKRKKEGREE